MIPERDSRALAERVELDFHQRPNRLRRWSWWVTLALVAAGLAWTWRAAARGEHQTFASGHVSQAHAFIEKRCDLCHDRWSLWDRLASWDGRVSSVSTEKCRDCHDGAEHNALQKPNHFGEELGCADCHREHKGSAALSAVADARCVRCHADLANHTLPPAAGQKRAAGDRVFHKTIGRFDSDSATTGHPRFHLHELLASRATQDPKATASAVGPDDPLAILTRDPRPPRDPNPVEQLQDRGRVAFNHAVHLAPGLLDAKGNRLSLANNCEACHEPDADRRLMRPINYDKHCADCHPLRFDARYPDKFVPHGVTPSVVRGFLIDFYLQTLPPGGDDPAGIDVALPAAPRVLDRRLIPEADLRKARERAVDADSRMPAPLSASIERTLAERRVVESPARGCRYCHDVKADDDGSIASIVPTNIPRQWFAHARFDHDSHRFVDCRSCHRNFIDPKNVTEVDQSRDTGDVLIPTIDVCRNCHVEGGPKPAAGGRAPHAGAGTRCTECHTYHLRQHDQKKGTYGADFPRRFEAKGSNATPGSAAPTGAAGGRGASSNAAGRGGVPARVEPSPVDPPSTSVPNQTPVPDNSN